MTFYLDKRIQRSKAALKESCLTLLYEKKFDSISITEIVRTANYNRGTFYANFNSKEDLLNEIIQDVLKEMILQIRKPYQSVKKVNLKEMQIGDITLFEYLKDNAKLYRLLLSDHIRMDFRFQIAKAIEELFETEYEYELAEGSQISLKWLYIYRAHGIAGLIIRWIEEDFPTSSHYMAKQVVELMLISTETFNVKG
ncbi:TetR/AcrR family transcriptional regulator [Alkalihalobacterium alkalinitrilicum]|uniref:TetR/AcrR family transcriptional regulator n=1 Tax=Alkalihalobacterium alkalinitrilicum TaxID=427920 RepID=UPI0009951776|nr:TetR/AcrR family transcriptional regulator [Alkalihalobacterium alkalinitrilicum]